MKIIFLCGGLEPGHDGVGDYTRRLAIELIKHGNVVVAIALNDPNIFEVTYSLQSENSIDLNVLRLPSSLHVRKRIEVAKIFLNSFNPDLLSLQYVPFSFHPKGLSLTLNWYLNNLGKDWRWHIMFHELWVGMGSNSNLKLVYWGKIQKLLIKSLITKLKPVIIHTQTKLYQLQLEKMSINAIYLPLFSNIPVVTNNEHGSVSPLNTPIDQNTFVFILFGGIHPGAPIQQFANEVANYGRKHGVQFILKIVGRCGVEQIKWETIWKSCGLIVKSYGEQSVEFISNSLSTSSMGISTTPIAIVEKSGTAAAMREHGLPIICVSKVWKARGFMNLTSLEGILDYQFGSLGICLSQFSTVQGVTITDVGQKFVEDIHKVSMDSVQFNKS